ncbi:TetR/AcrR family transcriptional regulator [Kineosporia babensis]|uniref:TetR/AcrR family transcriptional regulator n=1 Tax=Kineosporia babensis TaxID=499548 RepID=A0A9X1NHN0_9ACTN|nr:TetR/AcrR family transcriptional regulator [Kineosporia babensis]MCD5315187.1 TetR/AcrR family transcriptional regulator [Kineosporia babensis]
MTTARRVDGRQRVLDAALAQFAKNGVGATSLQMIADEMGVTKAALYYHFKTKEEIVLAVVQPALRRLSEVLEEAEAQRSQAARTRTFLDGFVRLVVQNRTLLGLAWGDAHITQIGLGHVPGFEGIDDRFMAILLGEDPTMEQIICADVALSGIAISASAPRFAEMNDDDLAAALIEAGQRLVPQRRRRSS